MATQPTDETAPKPRRGRPPKAKTSPKPSPPEGGAPVDPAPPADTGRRQVRVQAAILRAALKDVTGLVKGEHTTPILGQVLLQAGPGSKIQLVTTDLDAWAERDCASEAPAAGERGFTVTLPAKPLAAILGEIDGEAMVTLSLDTDAGDEELQQAWRGQVLIAAGRSRFRLHCLPPAEFPLPKPFAVQHSFELSCSALEGDFARVEHAISSEETRYYLNGVFLHVQQEEGEPPFLCLAATDGHRLARLRLAPPDGATSFPSTIVGRWTVALLDKLLTAAAKAHSSGSGSSDSGEPATVLVEIDGDHPGAMLRFSLPAAEAGSEITLTAKSIDGTFPDYRRVIPSAPEHSVLVERTPLLEAVRRVGVLASDRTRCVKAVLSEDRLELVVTTPEVGEAREEVPCSYAGPEVAIGFNGQFWRETLAALACDEVSMAFDQDGSTSVIGPVLVRAAGQGVDRDALVQVLMPMRV